MVIVIILLTIQSGGGAPFCLSLPPRSFALHVAVSIGVVDSDPDDSWLDDFMLILVDPYLSYRYI